MIHQGINKIARDNNKRELVKRTRLVSTIFVLASFLPVVIVLLFAFNVLNSKKATSTRLEEPVAKVIAPNAIGTAFLVSPTKLITARHVVDELNIGDDIVIDFDKAVNRRQITGKVLYYQPDESNPRSEGGVTLDYFLTDIAIIEIPEVDDIEPLEIGDSDFVDDLYEIILIGYPHNDYSKTDGKINSSSYQDYDLFKSDVAVNPGNSGGPAILKDDNTVIGIIVGSPGGPNDQGENVIIKINNAIEFIESNGIILD